MPNLNTVKDKLAKLVKRFESKQKGEWDEAATRKSLIDGFWEALGWDTDDPREVEVEKRTEIDEHLKRADYAFLEKGRTKFLVEAKQPSKNLTRNRDAIFQVKRYVFNTPDTNLGILHDFEEFIPYLVIKKPSYDLPLDGLQKKLIFSYEEYPDRADELLEMFSRESVLGGSIEALLPKGAKLERVTETVNREFFADLMKWRLEIAKSIAKSNPRVSDHDINSAVNHLLNRILFLRVIEDRKIENYDPLDAAVTKWKKEELGPLFAYLIEVFKRLDPKYNGAIFAKHHVDSMLIDDKPLYDCIRNLYYPQSPYQFSEMPIEVIGNSYEQYLGSVLRTTPARQVKLEEKPEVRKAGGVYYTPKYIVDYIVEQTVGKLVEGKTPAQVSKLRILDPACGSGSFLIGAFERLQKYYIDYYTANPKKNKGYLCPDYEGNLKLDILVKKKILEENIYGVDIDSQAVDITEFSLYVKMLEGEENLPMFAETYLPELKENIKCGNSLIGWDILDMDILPTDPDERQAELERINPFDWEKNFPEIFSRTDTEQGVATSHLNPEQGVATPCSLHAYHITWVTYGSRVSERMVEYKDVIRRRRLNKGQQPLVHGVVMDDKMEVEITGYIAETVRDMKLKVLAYNICRDHVHMALVCEEKELPEIVRRLKGRSAHFAKKNRNIPKEEEFHLWAQKYNRSFIDSEEKLRNCIEYIENNRIKHDFPVNKGLLPLVRGMLSDFMDNGQQPLVQSMDRIPRTSGGFDAVIGNPPYVLLQTLDTPKIFDFLKSKYQVAAYKIDTYQLFIEKGISLLREAGYHGYIMPISFLRNKHSIALRRYLLENTEIELIRSFYYPIFHGASVDTCIAIFKKTKKPTGKEVQIVKSSSEAEKTTLKVDKSIWLNHEDLHFAIDINTNEIGLCEKIESISFKWGDIGTAYFGIQTYDRKSYVVREKTKEFHKLVIDGKNIGRYVLELPQQFVDFRDDSIKSGGNPEVYQKPRIVVLQIGRWPTGTFAGPGIYTLNTIYNLYFTKSTDYNLFYVLGIINSKLVNWYWVKQFYDHKKTFPKIKKKALLSIPIRTIDFDNPEDVAKHDRMVSLVEDMLALNKRLHETESPSTRKSIEAQIAHTDRKIDELVYDLYGLTDDEIAIVEESAK